MDVEIMPCTTSEFSPDWDDRISGYNDEQKKIYSAMKMIIGEFADHYNDESDWVLYHENKKDDIYIETKKS